MPRRCCVRGDRRGNGARARGWANWHHQSLSILPGAGVAALAFGAVNILPYGWRALYVIGAVPLFLVAYPAPPPAGDQTLRGTGTKPRLKTVADTWTCCKDMVAAISRARFRRS